MPPNGEHGPDRLYSKFIVTRRSTGETLAEDEFYFVLRPERDVAAVAALQTYAAVCEHLGYENLAHDIRVHLVGIESK